MCPSTNGMVHLLSVDLLDFGNAFDNESRIGNVVRGQRDRATAATATTCRQKRARGRDEQQHENQTRVS